MAVNVLPANITVPFEEVSDPPPSGGQFDREGRFTDTKILKCAWNRRIEFARQLVGGGTASGFRLPAQHPDVPSAFARDVSFQAFGKPSASGSYVTWPYSLCRVQYSSGEDFTDDTEDGTPFLREEFSGFSEAINVPGRYFWNAIAGGVQEDPLPQTVAPIKTVRGATWKLTWLNLSSMPTTFLSLVGKTNSGALTSRRYGTTFAAETLLYGEPQITGTFNTDGSYQIQATLTFQYKPTGWNKFFGKPGDEATPNFIYPQGSATPFKPVELDDFSSLYNLA